MGTESRNPNLEGSGAASGSAFAAGDMPSRYGVRPLFPLRLRALRSEGPERRRCLAKRLRAARESEALVANAVRALNALAEARGDGGLQLVPPSRAEPDACLSAAQSSALNNIGRAVKACLSVPKPAELFPDGALCELLRSRDVYDVQQPLAVAPI